MTVVNCLRTFQMLLFAFKTSETDCGSSVSLQFFLI
jgi:hypothetical protein